jgi:hypothetical protein
MEANITPTKMASTNDFSRLNGQYPHVNETSAKAKPPVY